MSFRWEAYLELAQQLATGPAPPEGDAGGQGLPPAAPPDPSEAALRTAVSRAYYSAYHLAREYVEHEGLASVGKQDAHKSVWEALGTAGGKPRPRQERAIREKGFTLHNARKAADYEIDRPSGAGASMAPPTPEARRRHWKSQADLAVQQAGTIRALLGQLNPRN